MYDVFGTTKNDIDIAGGDIRSNDLVDYILAFESLANKDNPLQSEDIQSQ